MVHLSCRRRLFGRRPDEFFLDFLGYRGVIVLLLLVIMILFFIFDRTFFEPVM